MLNNFKEYARTQSAVTDEQFAMVISYLTPLKVNRGDVLLRQDEVSKNIYFVSKGCLRSYVTDVNNKSHILEFAPENWWLGDPLSLFQQIPSSFNIDAVEDSVLLLAGMDFFIQAPQIFPEFHTLYISHMHQMLRSTQKRLRHLLGSNGDERYLDFLATYPELGVRLPQHMIASYLGISPESLSRIRNKLAQK
jgi:CRP/FNR family transcriptional regulator, anaerobic regulatory protein